VRYISTRGAAQPVGFEEAMLSGLAGDGGLYVPERWPALNVEMLKHLRGRPYAQVAVAVIAPFVKEFFAHDELHALIADAYAGFGHPAVAPLGQLDSNQWLLELFHGPTLAFKDLALQLVARLMDRALARRAGRATVLCATSGDTGGAAIEAFRSSSRISIFVLHPHQRVSDVQRRQMTTVCSPNVHNLAIDGNFDDCQALVKAMFRDWRLSERAGLTAANSINWARIAAQVVYYVTSALALGAPERHVSFTVPTGNFGNVYAAYVAKRMGLPIDRLVVACNVNDILDRALTTGRYQVHAVTPSSSPSMDIQISGNFERLLFEAAGRDAGQVVGLTDELTQSAGYTLPSRTLAAIRADFGSGSADEAATLETIASVYRSTGRIIDPHTAVGYAVARKNAAGADAMVTLATAHPAKFPQAVEKALGIRPELPSALRDLFDKQEEFSVLPNNLQAVQDHVLSRI
jgi:threonine synthase